MIYAYVRVSTDKQTIENQRFEIGRFCDVNNLKIDRWIEERISGTKSVQERKLGRLLKRMKKGDTLICSELSRLGRNLLMIMSILHQCMERNIKIWSIKDNYRLGNDISCMVLAFAFGLSAEIERKLIADRKREALARKKAEGIRLGRPVGSKNKFSKLEGKEQVNQEMLASNIPKSTIAKRLKVERHILLYFLKEKNIRV